MIANASASIPTSAICFASCCNICDQDNSHLTTCQLHIMLL
jgi:hypothetical protein